METTLQQQLRLEASRRGWRLWRNNNGACQDATTGRQIRYGLGNDSAQMNRHLKSSDLIGVIPIIITPEMIGRKIGIFASIEVKRPGWNYAGTPREQAQLAWLNMITGFGGYGRFVSDLGDL